MGGKTTTKVETAPLSKEGLEYKSYLDGLYQIALDEAGFTATPTEKTVFENPEKQAEVQGKLVSAQERLSKVEQRIADRNASMGGNLARNRSNISDPLEQERNLAVQQVNVLKSELDGLPRTTYNDFSIQKKPDIRVQAAIGRYGAGSQEAKDVQDSINQAEVDKAYAIADVDKRYLESVTKMFDTATQIEKSDASFDAIRNVITQQATNLMNKVGQDSEALRRDLTEIGAQIDRTGFDVADALLAANIQIDKTGENLNEVLTRVNNSSYDRAKFEYDLLSQKIDTQISQQAALLGLPPGSQYENFQKAKLKTDAMTGLVLNLNQREAEGALGIASMVGQEKQKIALSRVALAESQGAKREDLAKSGFALSDAQFQKEQAIQGSLGQSLVGLEQNKRSQAFNLEYGQLPQLMSAGQGAFNFNFGQQQQEQQAINQQMAVPSNQLGTEQQRSLAETTTTVKKSPGFMDVFTGIVGTAAAGAGSYVSATNPVGRR